MADRIATLTSHLRTLSDITLKQKDLADINRQVSSGLKADSYDDLAGIVERISASQTKISRIDNYINNNKSVTTELQIMDQSLDQIQKTLEEFASTLVIRRGAATSEQMNFQGIAQEKLDRIKASLNVTVAGRYIFSGSKTDIPPVEDNPSLTTIGQVDSTYYQGNNEILTARVTDTRQLDYGITANDDAFQQAIAAVLTAMDGDLEDDQNTLQQAADLISQAIDSLGSLRAKTNSSISAVNTASSEHETMKIYWKQSLADDTETDVAEASIKLAADQTILQATYQVFALTSKLKLADYLN